MIFRFGSYSVDPERLELAGPDGPISVQPQVFALLVFLLENRDRVVSKDEIIENVWDGRIVSDGTLNARINAARRALGDTGEDQSVIRTFPRRGFRFVAETESVAGGSANEPEAVGLNKAATGDDASIVVLPFTNMSGDPEQEYFADGLTEDLITDLSKISSLFVIARHSAFTFKNTTANVTEIGENLGVAHVLEGSVRKAGNQVRINAQLIEARSGGHVWADRYDSELDDIFALQDEITAKIISALKVNLSSASSISRGTESVEAYELNMRGKAKFFMFNPENNRECIDLHEQAIAIDPNFSDAWAGLVFPYQSGFSFMWPGYEDGLVVATEKALKAVELAPNSSLARNRLGWVQTFFPDREASIANFEKAIELEPNNADSYIWFAEALNFAGYPDRAIEMVEKSLRIDPVAPPNLAVHIGHAQFLLGNLESAREKISHGLDAAPTFPVPRIMMIAILCELGEIDQAKYHMSELLKYNPQHSVQAFDDRYPYHNAEHRKRVLKGLRMAGLPET